MEEIKKNKDVTQEERIMAKTCAFFLSNFPEKHGLVVLDEASSSRFCIFLDEEKVLRIQKFPFGSNLDDLTLCKLGEPK